jgi:cytochrome c oxidase assembly factor CtaG
MNFWCSATGAAWTWQWRAYPGVWLFIILLALAMSAWNRAGARAAGRPPRPAHPLFVAGLVVLWLSLDWPIGALGAGYLASVHMLQFLLMASPVPALVIFTAIVLLTHLPPLVDRLMATQLGSMAIDLLWIFAGCVFWWPVVLDVPHQPRFTYPVKMGYLVLGVMFSPIMFGLAAFLAYSTTPLYGVFELAPPLPGISSHHDHQLAGVLMSVGGAVVAFAAISVIFFRWNKESG